MKTTTKVLMIAGLAVGCGGVEADKQSERKLSKPDFQIVEQGFFLNDGAFDKRFAGSTIVWAENPNADGVTGVAKVSSSIIRNVVKRLEYIDANIIPLKDKFDALAPQLGTKKASLVEAVKKSYETAVYAAATWFAGADGKGGKVGEVALKLATEYAQPATPQEIEQVTTNFTLYCEAKLWERAVRHTFIYEQYRGRRPTPSAMCEGVYKKLGLLSTDTELCKGDESYRSYFGCLWHEGVLKTKLWTLRYGPDSDAVKVLAALSDRSLMNLFSVARQGERFLKQDGVLTVQDMDSGSSLRVDVSFTAAPAGPMRLSAYKIIANMEEQPIPNDDTLRLFPATGRQEAAQAFLNAANDAIRQDIAYFNLLKNGGYVNENQFNALFQKPAEKPDDPSSVQALIRRSKEEQEQAVQRFPSILKISDPEVLRRKADMVPLINKVKDIGAKAAAFRVEIDTELPCESGSKTLACAYKSLAADAVKTVMPDDVTQAVWQSSVRLWKSDDGKFLYSEAKLSAASALVSKGCAKMADVECPPSFAKDALSFDADTGDVTIRIPVSNMQAQGLTRSSRTAYKTNLSFSEIAEPDLRGATVVYAGTLSLVDKLLLTFIGDVRIEREEKSKPVVLAHGAIKMVDQTPIQQVKLKELAAKLNELREQM